MKSYLMLVVWALVTVETAMAAEPVNDSSPWPQFRGPRGQGHVDVAIPVTWGEKKNVAWKTTLPGKGSSSPAIADGKAWVTTVVPTNGGGLSLRMIGVELRSGEIKHDVELFTVAKPPELHARNTPASPTPAVVNGRVIASFGRDGVGCVDAATGKVLWRNETLKVDYETGPGSSPVPYKDHVILPCDGADAQFVVAIDAATGAIAWKTEGSASVSIPQLTFPDLPERKMPGSVDRMAKQPKKNPVKVRQDFAQNAFRVVQEATGQAPKTPAPKEKDPAAVALGAKGGAARAKGMSKEKRTEAAKKAASSRWMES